MKMKMKWQKTFFFGNKKVLVVLNAALVRNKKCFQNQQELKMRMRRRVTIIERMQVKSEEMKMKNENELPTDEAIKIPFKINYLESFPWQNVRMRIQLEILWC
jgi:hypothetical protein